MVRTWLLVVAAVAFVVVLVLAFVLVVIPATAPAPAGPDESQTYTSIASPPSGPAATKAAGAIPTGPHPTPQEITFQGCPPGGDGTDPELNMLKNRVDPVQNPAPVDVQNIVKLPWPTSVNQRHMANWPADARAQVAKYNGVGVVTEGYFLRVTPEGAESTNCHATDANSIDFHEWIAPKVTDTRVNAIVAEITPRLRAQHPGWTLANVPQLAKSTARVRVTGWLMLDPEHPDQVGKTRGTIWEIHPITKIEVFQNGQWVDLDSLKGDVDGQQPAA